jgi:DNA-binding GntR family transcriptional regulator
MQNIQLDRPPTLVELIVAKLQEAIIRGTIPPGTRLTEEKLSQELNTSRTPLREALFMLELMGFVRRPRGGGWQVPRFDVEKVLERFEDRVMLEVYAVLRSTAESRAAFLRKTGQLLSRMKKAAEALDYGAYREADLQFHRSLLSLSSSRHLRRKFEDALKHIDWIRQVTIAPLIDMRISFEDHQKIISALREEDVHGAVGRLLEHTDRQVLMMREKLASPKAASEVAT